MISGPSELAGRGGGMMIPSDFDKNRNNPCSIKRPSITACPLRLSGLPVVMDLNIGGGRNSSSLLQSRGVVPGGAGGAMALPDFSRSVNPISTRRGRLCPPHYNWHPRIFRPSYGPVHYDGVAKLQYFRSQLSLILCSHMIETYQLNN